VVAALLLPTSICWVATRTVRNGTASKRSYNRYRNATRAFTPPCPTKSQGVPYAAIPC
jgi:hypothetical protein